MARLMPPICLQSWLKSIRDANTPSVPIPPPFVSNIHSRYSKMTCGNKSVCFHLVTKIQLGTNFNLIFMAKFRRCKSIMYNIFLHDRQNQKLGIKDNLCDLALDNCQFYIWFSRIFKKSKNEAHWHIWTKMTENPKVSSEFLRLRIIYPKWNTPEQDTVEMKPWWYQVQRSTKVGGCLRSVFFCFFPFYGFDLWGSDTGQAHTKATSNEFVIYRCSTIIHIVNLVILQGHKLGNWKYQPKYGRKK